MRQLIAVHLQADATCMDVRRVEISVEQLVARIIGVASLQLGDRVRGRALSPDNTARRAQAFHF